MLGEKYNEWLCVNEREREREREREMKRMTNRERVRVAWLVLKLRGKNFKAEMFQRLLSESLNVV